MYRRLVFINLLFSEVIKRGQCILKDPISISTFLPINFRQRVTVQYRCSEQCNYIFMIMRLEH